MKKRILGETMIASAVALALVPPQINAQQAKAQTEKTEILDAVVITARKIAEPMQKVPLAVSVLSAHELEVKGITNLGDFITSPSPFLRIIPYAGNPSLPLIGIRGLSTDDPGQASNDPAVGVYVDNVYMARAQGSLMDLAELDHIEILRGPQGTLFGRNALGGAVSVVTKKPTGELGFNGALEFGNYQKRKAVGHLNLPSLGDLKVKVDVLQTKRDGTVENRDHSQWSFGQYDRSAYRFDALYDSKAIPGFTAQYTYDKSRDRTTFGYVQRVTGGAASPLPLEPDRASVSLTPEYLPPSATDTAGHLLTLTWEPNDNLSFKSISSYRTVDYRSYEDYANFFAWVPLGGTFAMSGFKVRQTDEQSQFSQEFQILGKAESGTIGKIKYATGLFFFREKVDDVNDGGTTIFNFANGFSNPAAAVIVNPYFSFSGGANNWRDRLESRSHAIYGQASWQPVGFDDRLELTAGLRYTKDSKKGDQIAALTAPPLGHFNLPSSHVDRNLTVSYAIAEDANIYIRNATGYRAGGVSLRDPAFIPFQSDTSESWELGSKLEMWNRKLRLNTAIYNTVVEKMRTSYASVVGGVSITRLFNATGEVKIRGFETELTVQPIRDVTLSGAYSYTDVKFPTQIIPIGFAGAGGVQPFTQAQAPKNAVSIAVDWKVANLASSVLEAHIDGYKTSAFVTVPQLTNLPVPSYTLFNARLTLKDINVGKGNGDLSVALWAKNLTDRKYKIFAMYDSADNANLMQYGEPRTFGLTLSYNY